MLASLTVSLFAFSYSVSQRREAAENRGSRARNKRLRRETEALIDAEDAFNKELDFAESEADALLQLALKESEENARKRDTEAARISAEFERYRDASRKKIDRLQWQLRRCRKYMKPAVKTPALPSHSDTKLLKRKKGKKLHLLEQRALRHTHQVCIKEKQASRFLWTGNPVLRTSLYHGVSERTTRDVLQGKHDLGDKRGKYERQVPRASRFFAGYLRELVVTMNLEGKPTTLSRVRKALDSKLRDVYAAEPQTMPIVPKRETIRKIMREIGFNYK